MVVSVTVSAADGDRDGAQAAVTAAGLQAAVTAAGLQAAVTATGLQAIVIRGARLYRAPHPVLRLANQDNRSGRARRSNLCAKGPVSCQGWQLRYCGVDP